MGIDRKLKKMSVRGSTERMEGDAGKEGRRGRKKK